MNKKRTQRIASEIHKVVSNCLYNGIKDPRVDTLTTGITEVKVTNDLSFATIYVSVIGDNNKKKHTIDGLKKAKGYIKREIGNNVDLRHVPELIFKLDLSSERGQHIENILEQLKDDKDEE